MHKKDERHNEHIKLYVIYKQIKHIKQYLAACQINLS